MALPQFTGVGTTQGAGSWYVEPTGAIRTIRPGMATVIECLGAVDITKVGIPELDGLIQTGGSWGNLARPVDLAKFEFVNIEFNEDLLHLGQGNQAANTSVTSLVNSLPTTTPLIFVGFSEGAAVLSDIFDQIRSGSMSARSAYMLGGVMFGNPRRQTGVTLTDPTYGLYPDPLVGGSGISSTPLSSTPSSWWECALPGDPVASQLNTASHSDPAYWCRQFYLAVEAGQDYTTVVNTAAAEGQSGAVYAAANTLLNIATSPHNNYGITKPFTGSGDTRTFLQVGVDHVNSFTPSVPSSTAHTLHGIDNGVAPGSTITAGAEVMWLNLPLFGGDAISISVDVFDATDTLITNVTSSTTVVTGSSNSAYQKLTGSFVMPDGADHARLVYTVAAAVMTTGIVRFQNAFFEGGLGPVVHHQLVTPTNPKLLALKETMLHEGSTLSRAIASDAIAEFKQTNQDKTWVVTIYDFLWRPVGELGDDLMELTGTDPRNNVPTAQLKIKGTSQHIEHFKGCQQTLVGITIETGGSRQAFYVDVFDWEYSADAEWVGTAHLKGIWDVLSYLVVWPNFLFPIQVQIPSHAIFIGPIVSVVLNMVAECAFRIQTGLWEFVNNALSLNPDIRAWFGTLLLSNGNFFEMLKTPVYVSGVNPFLDSSPLVARTVRMETCTQVILDITRAYGVDVRVDLWLPGDEQPDEWTRAFPMLGLDQPTYVVSCVDRSQITGPTGTIIDSVLRTIVDLGGSFFGEIEGVIQSVPGMTGVFTSPLLGINFVPPWAVLVAPDIGQKGSIAKAKFSFHTPKGWQHIIGGRCVSGETLVHTADGLLEAKTLDGLEVMTLSQDGVYRPARWMSYGEQQLHKVTFRNGDEIYATAGHEWVVTSKDERVTTLDLTGHHVPHITHGDVEVVSVKATDRIETVYCCEELVTNTWVAGSGYLTGNSPKWLNDLLNAIFGWILDAISIFVGIIGIPSDLLSGLLNNAFLAFQLIEHFGRRQQVGPYHPAIEVMHATPTAPYNIETIFGFINALWDSRGYMSGQFTFRDGDVYKYGRDIFRGGLVSVVFDNRKKLFTDYVELVLYRYTPDARDVIIQVGDGKAQESPLAKHQRMITAILESINVVTLAPQS